MEKWWKFGGKEVKIRSSQVKPTPFLTPSCPWSVREPAICAPPHYPYRPGPTRAVAPPR
jgi:hypothetical protein